VRKVSRLHRQLRSEPLQSNLRMSDQYNFVPPMGIQYVSNLIPHLRGRERGGTDASADGHEFGDDDADFRRARTSITSGERDEEIDVSVQADADAWDHQDGDMGFGSVLPVPVGRATSGGLLSADEGEGAEGEDCEGLGEREAVEVEVVGEQADAGDGVGEEDDLRVDGFSACVFGLRSASD